MHLSWNLLGVVVWIIILAWLVFITLNIRRRHLKMIVVQKEHHSMKTTMIDIIEILIFLVAFFEMFWFTFLDHPNPQKSNQITTTYSVKPLVIQTKNAQGYYVIAKEGSKKNTIQYYTYWTNGAKYSIPGNNSSISDSHQPIALNAKNYSWPPTGKYDKKYQSAYVITMISRYKVGWKNGIFLRSGHVADDYSIIRIPSSTFIKLTK